MAALADVDRFWPEEGVHCRKLHLAEAEMNERKEHGRMPEVTTRDDVLMENTGMEI